MKKNIVLLLEDLRFMIGFFFLLIGLVLILAGNIYNISPHFDININLIVGISMEAFGLLMTGLTLLSLLKYRH